jgi:hypothetical protein
MRPPFESLAAEPIAWSRFEVGWCILADGKLTGTVPVSEARGLRVLTWTMVFSTPWSSSFCLFGLSSRAYANLTRNSDGRSGCSVRNQTNGSEGKPPDPERSSLVNVVDEERYRFVRLSCAHVSLS